MITFDKLKIVASIDAIVVTDFDAFEKVEKAGRLTTLKFYQESPFLLMIKVDYEEQEVVVEFCGKVLGKDYPQLISADTIRKCFDNISALGFCSIDAEAMLDGDVVKADVTKDIHGIDVPQLSRYIQSHISNYHQYVSRLMRNGNLVIEKNVTTRKMKKRMTIYDKGREMQKAENKRFVEAYGLEHAFDDTCRFEVNLDSKEQVRTALMIDNTRLKNVLVSSASPIYDFVTNVIGHEDPEHRPVQMSSRKEYFTRLVLQDCQYDLAKVEARMRELYPQRGTNFKQVMKPYREMMEKQTQPGAYDFQTVLNKLR